MGGGGCSQGAGLWGRSGRKGAAGAPFLHERAELEVAEVHLGDGSGLAPGPREGRGSGADLSAKVIGKTTIRVEDTEVLWSAWGGGGVSLGELEGRHETARGSQHHRYHRHGAFGAPTRRRSR